jgi:WD40 repeat protein
LFSNHDVPPTPFPPPITHATHRFGSGPTRDVLFAVVNAKSRKRAWLCTWSLGTWKRRGVRPIASKPVTAFALARQGDVLALGSADLAVTVWDAVSGRRLQHFPHIHSFPVTAIAFSPSGRTVVSGSADSTIALMEVRRSRGRWGVGWKNLPLIEASPHTSSTPPGSGWMVFLALLLVLAGLLAILFSMYLSHQQEDL